MRRRMVRDALMEVGAEATCAVLAEVERRPPGADHTVQDRLREAIRDVLLGIDSGCAIPYKLHRDVYESARRSDDADVMGILRSLPVREELEVALLPHELSEISLARNPYCPIAIAMRLIATLPLPELREMRGDPGMHEETHASVERELARRRGEISD